MESEYIKEIAFEDADSFLKAINYGGELYNVFNSGFVFRGHGSDKYSLVPYALREGALYRYYPLKDLTEEQAVLVSNLEYAQILQEYNILQLFYNNCDRHILRVPECERLRHNVIHGYDELSIFGEEEWLPVDLWEIGALAQHYGLPTRLLDWSTNIHTALYFAVRDYIKPLSVSEQISYQKEYFMSRGKLADGRIEIWALDTKVTIAKDKMFPLKLIRPAYNGNPNLAAQEGVFTLWSIKKPVISDKDFKICVDFVNRSPLDELLVKELERQGTEIRPYMYRVTIPRKSSVAIYSYLKNLGHTAAKLFPGYGGVSQSIQEEYLFRNISGLKKSATSE